MIMDNNNYWKQFYKNKDRQPPSSFYESIKDRVTKDDVVLDVGAGDGRDTYPLSARCKEIYTVEPNNELPWGNFKSIIDVTIKPDIVYARFLFHAVEEGEENKVLRFCLLTKPKLFAEFRTKEVKEDNSHKRRPIYPEVFISKLKKIGYKDIHLTLGHFSPHGDDNPLLARVIAQYD